MSKFVLIDSKKPQNKVEVTGFERLDEDAHMMEWLRRGQDYQSYIIHDVENELYAQDPGAQLLSVNLKERPHFETKVRKNDSGSQAIVMRFLASLPILLRVKASNGVVWLLDVDHAYQAEGMDESEKFKLSLSFAISGSRAESS